MTIRVLAFAFLAVLAAVALTVGETDTGWEPIHLVGLAALAVLAIGLLSHDHDLP